MRSREKQQRRASSSLLGQRAAKLDAANNGRVVFGVVVEEQETPQLWQVVYVDDTMALLDQTQVQAAIACATEHNNDNNSDNENDNGDAHDPQLIVHGKRKRTHVNYRELNDAMFAGKADSDEEADADAGAGDAVGERLAAVAATARDDKDEDYVPKPKKKTSKQQAAGRGALDADTTDSGVDRSRRARKSVDYNALNEGLLSY